jgi:hypothetical protein
VRDPTSEFRAHFWNPTIPLDVGAETLNLR